MATMITARSLRDLVGQPLQLRCPACDHLGTFEVVGRDVLVDSDARAGLRRCPSMGCKALVFYAATREKVVTFPPVRLDFDKTGIPPETLKAFEEAVTCHANECFIAAAIMVRKTLDLICKDRGAIGDDLKQRIASLRTKVVIPNELLDGMDALRLLGNDAAHLESATYDDVGKDEVEIAVEFAKEILKAVYQYSNLLGKLRSFQKPQGKGKS